MAELINDSYVFRGGVNLQAQWQSNKPVEVEKFTLRVQSSKPYKVDGLGNFSAGNRDHTIIGHSAAIYSQSGTIYGYASADASCSFTLSGANISFGIGGATVDITTTSPMGILNVAIIPGTPAIVYAYMY